MTSFEQIRRNAQARVTRFHTEASTACTRRAPSRSFRARAACYARSFAAWIEPDAAHPRGAPHVSP